MGCWTNKEEAQKSYSRVVEELQHYSWTDAGVPCWITLVRLLRMISEPYCYITIIGYDEHTVTDDIPDHVPGISALNNLPGVCCMSYVDWACKEKPPDNCETIAEWFP